MSLLPSARKVSNGLEHSPFAFSINEQAILESKKEGNKWGETLHHHPRYLIQCSLNKNFFFFATGD